MAVPSSPLVRHETTWPLRIDLRVPQSRCTPSDRYPVLGSLPPPWLSGRLSPGTRFDIAAPSPSRLPLLRLIAPLIVHKPRARQPGTRRGPRRACELTASTWPEC